MASAAPLIEINGTGPASMPSAANTANGIPIHPSSPSKPNLMPIAEHPIENFRPMRVICIGAGFSGIYIGIRIPELLRNVSLQIYEKNDGLGGTWWENKYPGCACDIPAHSYVYTFAPNRDWSSFYASSDEIQRYLEGVADKYSVRRFVKTGHKVVRCEWDERGKKWMVDVQVVATGEILKDEADFVISARGGLNDYAWPQIEGLWDFKGAVMHSANWNKDFDFQHKKVGVIGSGSSAIQIVPSLQKLPGIQMSCFVRGRTWIAQSFGESSMEKLHLDHQKCELLTLPRDRIDADVL
jgi:cation diffusion facilitator CzcD-associated flavoprotein CzcO